MDKSTRRAAELISGIALTGKKYPSPVPYYPQKTAYHQGEERIFQRRSADKLGIRPSSITDMLTALEDEARANVHSILVVRDGFVIAEASAPGYGVNIRHLSHSMSKSVTGMAIGFLVDEGKLELSERLVDFFPELMPSDKRFSSITVEHLLTMTSGVKFSEVGSVTDRAWSQSFFESQMSFAPGERFHYNSMNSYMLARIVVAITGQTLTEFLTPRLFLPLGIKNFFWEKSPEGIEKGGWGLYMSAESWARLGELYLNRGKHHGRQILSEDWVIKSTSRQIDTDGAKGDFDYGYHVWVSKTGSDFLFNGMLGQNVWVIPDKNMVVSMNSGNNELFSKSPALSIIRDSLERSEGKERRIEVRRLKKTEKSFFESRRAIRPLKPKSRLSAFLRLSPKEPFSLEFEPLLGTYTLAENNSGILPLFVRVMQSNYSGGIEQVAFTREKNSLFLIATEGGKTSKIELGIYGYKESLIDASGEKYIVRALAESISDDRGTTYNIQLVFPELPNTRFISIALLQDGEISFTMTETPNHKMIEGFFEKLPISYPKISFVLDMFEKRLGRGFALDRIRRAFSPALTGANVNSDSFRSIIDTAEEKTREEIDKAKLIVSLAERFIFLDEDSDEDGDKKGEKKRGFFSRLFSKK